MVYCVFAGRIDCSLSKNGMQMCCEAAKWEWPSYHAVYCSPLKRTKQTLNAIFPHCTPIFDDRIIEIFIGDWEGQEKQSLDQQAVQLYQQGLLTPPNGEAPDSVDRRVISFVEDLFETYDASERILVVTHNGVLRSVKRNFVRNYDSLSSNNLGLLTLTDEDYHYFLRRR